MKRLVKSFSYAIKGLKTIIKKEANFRIHLFAAALALALAALLKFSLIEWVVIILVIALVLISEAFNTAVEKTIDAVIDHYDVRARDAKDIAAAAVMIMAFFAVVIGICLYGFKIYKLIVR